MKPEEKIAEKYLIDLGYKTIDFEPRGKSTAPDFRIDGNIGIEVRRLNKHITLNGVKEPIEKLEYQFIPRLKKLLRELDNPDLPFSIGMTIRYKRPIKLSNRLISDLKDSILNSTQDEIYGTEINFNNQIAYELYKGHGKSDQTYKLIIQGDRDKGGIVQDARYEATKICIEEKSNKLNYLVDIYSELWLILIDDIFSRVDYTTKQDFKRFTEIKSIFKRVIIISKHDYSKWIDLYPW